MPPEHIFDQTHGEVFVVRVAGNIAGLPELGSLEYAVGHLNIPLVLVMGHEGCGAVKAALDGSAALEALGRVIEEIAPAVKPVLEEDEQVDIRSSQS